MFAVDNFPGQLFHVTLEDSSGSMRCTAFDDAVDAFWRTLNVGEEYEISNGKIRKSNQPATFEMSLTVQSSVVHCPRSFVAQQVVLPPQIPQVPTNFGTPHTLVRPTFVTNPSFVANTLPSVSLDVTPPPQLVSQPSFEHNPAFQASLEIEEPHQVEINLPSEEPLVKTTSSSTVSPTTTSNSLSPDLPTNSTKSSPRNVATAFVANPAFADDDWDSSSSEEAKEKALEPETNPTFFGAAFSRSRESLLKQ